MINIECPISGQNSNSCKWTPIAGLVRDFPEVGVVKCQKCQLVTPDKDLRKNVNYQNGTMHNWAGGYGGLLPGPASDLNRRFAAIKQIEDGIQIKTILDFGCGSGEMLEVLSQEFEAIGVEPDEGSRNAAINKGLSVYKSSNEVFENKIQVDVVTLFHVIEHLYEPTKELEMIHRLLKPNGWLIIETPNSNDVLLTEYESNDFQNFTYWSHHPMLHSHDSLHALVSRTGFKIFNNQGVQRYDLNNHLYWLSKRMPGGHEIWKKFLSEATTNSYAEDLIKNKNSDTIWLVAQKNALP
jgi:SAM-dependent methyltransferase